MWLLTLVATLAAGVGGIEQLDDESFHSAVRGQTAVVALRGTLPCERFQKLLPELQKLERDAPELLVGLLDCHLDNSVESCRILEAPEGETVVKLLKSNAVYNYDGKLKAAALRAFAAEGYKQVTGTPLRRHPLVFAGEERIVPVDDDNISTLESRNLPALIEFYAPWCQFCRRVRPKVAQLAGRLAQEHPDWIVAAYNCSAQSAAMKRYGVSGYPTMKLLKHGLVYPYQGDFEVDALLSFMENPQGEGQPIPGPWGLQEEFHVFTLALRKDLRLVVNYKWNAAVIIYVCGALSGCLMVALISCLLPTARPRPAIPMPPAPSPQAADETKKTQ